MENVKDHQIQAQGETIKSLERKIESLEMELRKCLDPDSGELTSHAKAVAARAVPDGGPRLTRDEILRGRIERAIISAFMPIKNYRKGTHEVQEITGAWWYFRQILFDADLFTEDWGRKDFRVGIDLLNSMVDATHDYPNEFEQISKSNIDTNFFCFADLNKDKERLRAVEALIASLKVIGENLDHPEIKGVVSQDEILNMASSLNIIAACQRIWLNALDKLETV